MKRTTVIMLLPIVWGLTICLLTAFREKPVHSIRFKTLTSTIKSDTSGVIEAIIWNGEREQTILIDCTLSGKLFEFTGKVYPNDRNVTLYYSGQIKLK